MAKWGLFMVLLFVIWFVGWYVAAQIAGREFDRMVEQTKDRGLLIECEDRSIKGFPFRLGLHCSRAGIAHNRDVFRIKSGALRSAAQIYAPTEIVAELDSPFEAWSEGGPLKADWKQARLYGDFNTGGFDLVSLTFDEFGARLDDLNFKFDDGAAHVRPRPAEPDTLEVAGHFSRIRLFANEVVNIRPFSLSYDVAVGEGYAKLVKQRRPVRSLLNDPLNLDLRAVVLTTEDEGRLALSGPLVIDAQGRLNGTIWVGVQNTDALVRWAESVQPQLREQVELLGSSLMALGRPRTFGKLEMSAVALTLEKGVMRLGLITLGELPPIAPVR